MAEPSAELADRAARGDAEALRALLERHVADLRAFVRMRVGAELRRREESSDLVQSTCREVLQHAGRFQHANEAAFRRWLFTTALRKIADRADHWGAEKRAAAREEHLPSEVREEALSRCYASFTSPSQGLMAREEIERVERAFEMLGEEQREAISLAHVVGLSRAEIAAHMGKSEGAVRVLLHRALARLTELLGTA